MTVTPFWLSYAVVLVGLYFWAASLVKDGERRDDATDHIDTLTRERDEAQANALRYAIEVSRLLDLLDTLTREREAEAAVIEAAKAWRSAWLIATRIGSKEAVVLLESRCIALDEAVAERVVQPTTAALTQDGA
jgi:hypothetical protein